MKEILEKKSCCGCGSCYTTCKHNAIDMQLDEEGFEYPVINQDRCIDCGACQTVCPVIQYEKRADKRDANNNVQIGFVARNKHYEQRLISSSGSIFPPIATWILESGGIVVGAAFDENYNVIQKAITSVEELPSLQGSKYLQCKTNKDIFKQIKKELQFGHKILYTGMACQVEGLKAFLKKEYENLYTIDLICMGIPSYVVWQRYLQTFFNGEKIKSINFKEKSVGWDSFSFRVDTDKRVFKEPGMHNLYLRSMFLSWNMRPSCFHCPFKKAERISDFTLADAWGVYANTPNINDNKGLSSVIIHSEKGLILWNILKDQFDCVNVSIDDIARGNSNLISNKPQMGNRKLFYDMLSDNPKNAFELLCSIKEPSLLQRLKNKVTAVFNKKR